MPKLTKKQKIQKFNLKQSWKKIAVALGLVFTVLLAAGLFVTLDLLQKFEYAISEAQALTVNMNIQPATTTLQSGASRTLTLNLNSNGRQISFARGVVLFDTTKLELTGEIDVAASPLTQVIEKTSRANANSSGRAAIVLALAPDNRGNPPTGTVLLANLPFRAKTTSQNNVATQVSIDSGDIQVVDLQENNLTVSVGNSNITINPVAGSTTTPRPTATPIVNPTVRPTSSVRPTVRPTASVRPTIRPSVRPTVRPTTQPGGGGTGSLPGFPSGVNLSNLRQYCPLYKIYRGYAYRIYGSRYSQAFAYMDKLCGVR